MNLKNIMLSKTTPAQKLVYYMIPFWEISRKSKSVETDSASVASKWESTHSGNKIILAVMKMFYSRNKMKKLHNYTFAEKQLIALKWTWSEWIFKLFKTLEICMC